MICPNCSTDNNPAGAQCIFCGTALPSSDPQAPVVPPLPEQSDAQSTFPSVDPGQPFSAVPGPPPVPSAPPGYYGQTQAFSPAQNESLYSQQPHTVPYHSSSPDIMETLIPAHNPKALIGYYLAVFSIIPLLGIVLGIAAFVLGIMGLKEANRNPAAKGKTHAWVAIVVGGFFGFGYLILVAWIVLAALLSSSS
jgi:hypothetical protein